MDPIISSDGEESGNGYVLVIDWAYPWKSRSTAVGEFYPGLVVK